MKRKLIFVLLFALGMLTGNIMSAGAQSGFNNAEILIVGLASVEQHLKVVEQLLQYEINTPGCKQSVAPKK